MKSIWIRLSIAGLLILSMSIAGWAEDTRSSQLQIRSDIDWQVISSGGENNATSTNFGLSGTVAQTAVGVSSSTNFRLNQGFWQAFGGVDCVPGDADNSGAVDIDDIVYLVAHIFSGGPPPVPAACCGDADGSGAIDIDDVVYLVAYIFSGGPPPVDAC